MATTCRNSKLPCDGKREDIRRPLLKNSHRSHLHPILQNLSQRERPAFQEGNAPVHTSRCVQIWLLGYEDEVIQRNQYQEQPLLAEITAFIRLGIESNRYWMVCTGTQMPMQLRHNTTAHQPQ
ncbi:hypothetical protein TNCV_3978331 [Trichonephila clavipes]|nr:hypothetical protein TNCV_3978331 [Trichonephila clavipes]